MLLQLPQEELDEATYATRHQLQAIAHEVCDLKKQVGKKRIRGVVPPKRVEGTHGGRKKKKKKKTMMIMDFIQIKKFKRLKVN